MQLSIITINLNNRTGLEKTINSVVQQTFRHFQYIVIDGNSTDGSREVINKYEPKLNYFVVENDSGIYNAMNKGIRAASGEYCLFLNSGDYFIHKNILSEVVNELNGDEIIYGNGRVESADGNAVKVEIPSILKLDYFFSKSLFHPSSFIKRSLFDRYGMYNESNKIVSDWEFFIKTILVNKVKARKIPFEIAIAEGNGMSHKKENMGLFKEEVKRVLNFYFTPSVLSRIPAYNK